MSEIYAMPMSSIWLMQDGAPAHMARKTREFLRDLRAYLAIR